MNCKKCNRCTYDDKMKKLCLDLETRKLLLDLIKDGVLMQLETVEFINEIKINENIKQEISCGLMAHFDCLLPERNE